MGRHDRLIAGIGLFLTLTTFVLSIIAAAAVDWYVSPEVMGIRSVCLRCKCFPERESCAFRPLLLRGRCDYLMGVLAC